MYCVTHHTCYGHQDEIQNKPAKRQEEHRPTEPAPEKLTQEMMIF